MTNTRTVLGIVALLTCGYVAGQLVRAEAQATPKAYTECFGARLWDAKGDEVSAGLLPKLVRIPAGWTPVGDASAGAMVILCR